MVSYLPVDMPYQCLRQLLIEITPGLKTCNTVLTEDKTTNVGYGFASYATMEPAESACAILDGMPLKGKTLRAQMFENRGTDTADATLFVWGFPRTWGQQELLEYFAKFGRVLHGKVPYG